MVLKIALGDTAVDVVRKDIKNIHLSVHPPAGRVTVSAPLRMRPETIRVFLIAKLAWIRRQQRKLCDQEREAPREYLDRESHFVWGKRYLLKVLEVDEVPVIEVKHSRILLQVRPGASEGKKQALLDDWYRAELKRVVPAIISKWEPLIGVKVNQVYVQRMKTKWGSCNVSAKTIRLNAELVKKPPDCLEYIVVHEMCHFHAKHHDDRFHGLMDRYLPKWRHIRRSLNATPLAHTDWLY